MTESPPALVRQVAVLPSTARSRAWCFTYNNPPSSWEPGECEYCVYGREHAGSTGTEHLQGYVRFKTQKKLAGVRLWAEGAHWEPARGTVEQNFKYCTKENDWKELGTRPSFSSNPGGEATKRKWQEAWQLAKAGKLEELAAEHPDIMYQHYRTTLLIAKDHQTKPNDLDGVSGVWLHGVAGAGKSWKARRDYPNYYLKACNKWWDSYQGEEYVIIDDFDKTHSVLGHHLKIWADRYAFPAEMKGSSKQIRPKRIIVTSQFQIEDIWADDETRDALNRRFTVERVGEKPVWPIFNMV